MNVKLRLLKFLLLLFASGLTACTTGTLRVRSAPEKAEVFLASDGGQPTKIGETPLELDSALLNERRGPYVSLTIKKDGFQQESMWIPTGLVKNTVDISVKLEERKLPQQCLDTTGAVEKISRGVASVQTLITRGAYEEARMKLSALLSDYSGVSVLHDLMGNVNYLSRNLEAALHSYQRSLLIDSNNVDTQRMVNKIKSILEVRTPASQGGP